MRIAIVNQFVPPDIPPTARLVGELGEYLQSQGHEVDYIYDDRPYTKRSGSRMLNELIAHARIFWRGVIAPRPDLLIVLSSPPCLLVTAAFVALRHRAPYVHWAMDIYPEVALALDEIGPGPVSKFIAAAMNRAYRHAALIVALDSDMADLFKNKGAEPEVLAPWIPSRTIEALKNPAPVEKQSSSFVWLYSGNLGRAHEWETLLRAQAILEDRGENVELVFQGGGGEREAATRRAAELGLQNCTWRDYAPEDALVDSLRTPDVLVATQRPETQGLLWPSKLALMIRLRQPILWIGSPDSSIVHLLGSCPNTASFEPGQAAEVADWLLERSRDPRPGEPADLDTTSEAPFSPESGLETWRTWIDRLKKG